MRVPFAVPSLFQRPRSSDVEVVKKSAGPLTRKLPGREPLSTGPAVVMSLTRYGCPSAMRTVKRSGRRARRFTSATDTAAAAVASRARVAYHSRHDGAAAVPADLPHEESR